MSNGLAHGELSLFDCPRIRKSEFWQFIKLVAPHGSPPEGRTHWLSQDATDAFCLKCSKMFRFTKGSSNSVRRHMERFHRKELLKRQADIKKGGASSQAVRKTGAVASRSTSPRGAAGSTSRKAKRASDPEGAAEDVVVLTIPHLSGGKRHRHDGVSMRDPRHGVEALVRWLVLAKRPFTIVEEPGFELFAEAISSDQSFALPSREVLVHRLELMSENARFEVKQILKRDVAHFALSIEIWRAGESDSTLATVGTHAAIRCSYLNEEFATQSYVLEAFPIENLTGHRLLRLLQDSGLTKSSLSLLLLPRVIELEGSGLRVAIDVAASLDTLVRSMLNDSEGLDLQSAGEMESPVGKPCSAIQVIQATLLKFASLIKWVQSNSSGDLELERLVLGAATELPNVGEPSKWTLTIAYDTISRIVLMRSAIDGFAVRRYEGHASEGEARAVIPAHSWLLLEGLLVLWRPLHEVVQVAMSEKVCSLPFLLPIVTMAIQLFARTNLFDEVKRRYASIEESESFASTIIALDEVRRWGEHFLKSRYESLCTTLRWVSALDPRYARLRHLSDQERDHCNEQLLNCSTELYARQLPPIQQTTEVINTFASADFESDVIYGDARVAVQNIPGLMHRLLYDEDEDVPVPTDAVLAREAEIAQARLFAANEISVYFNEHQVRKTRIACPLEWWRANRERFPFLAPLARLWLSTRACGSRSTYQDRLLSSVFCDSLVCKEAQLLFKRVADVIVLDAHLQTTSTKSVSL